jgi:hypothetical protein
MLLVSRVISYGMGRDALRYRIEQCTDKNQTTQRDRSKAALLLLADRLCWPVRASEALLPTNKQHNLC